jgi:hypothetical protein
MYVEGNISARERVEAAPSKNYDNLSKDLMKEIVDEYHGSEDLRTSNGGLSLGDDAELAW